MGNSSDIMIATTKRDYLKIEKAQNKILNNEFFDYAEIEDYTKNGVECVLMEFYSIKYYRDFEEIDTLEKSLAKLKDGYVFYRIGGDRGEIEFRHRTKIPELMEHFDFILDIKQNLNKELGEEEEEFE